MNTRPPAPHGFKWVKYELDHGMEMWILACENCGATVALPRSHSRWHKKYGN